MGVGSGGLFLGGGDRDGEKGVLGIVGEVPCEHRSGGEGGT